MFERFLPLVSKPARYINAEINSVRKDFSKVKTKVCLFFPDTYEVGMSHLGLKILYHILNTREDTACERVFSPWTDYEERLRASEHKLASLESNLPLSEFDILGVTLQYELSYSNILTALDLAGIPLRAADRTDKHPIVIAGGPCTMNPGPLSDFIDVFFLGDAEEAVHELVELKQQHKRRQVFLETIARQEGFYVPEIGTKGVTRRFLESLEHASYPAKPVLPFLKPIHDRVTVEVARGCIRGCRFCQAGMIYRPYRERSPETVKALLHDSLRCTGYEELSLASLSAGDYTGIQPLVVDLMKQYHDSRVSISLPSLRVGTLTPEMVQAIADTRKTGFTLAPEAGTERLRNVINKPLSDSDLFRAAETIFKNGWNVLKLYFMIGLPTETDEDLDGIVRLVNEIFALGRKVSKRGVQLNITLSSFVPKPHTAFQWTGQASLEEIRTKQRYLEQRLRRRGIALKPHNAEMSLLEGAFARGDRTLGRVIQEAMRIGCRFDAWSECFDFRKWEEAFAKFGVAMPDYACRTFKKEEPLPWEYVHSGISKEFFQTEYQRALAAETTENCRMECRQCGLECKDGGTPSLGKPAALAPHWEYVHSGISKEFFQTEYQRALAAETTENCRMECRQCGLECKDGGTPSLGKPAALAPHSAPPKTASVADSQEQKSNGIEPSVRIRFQYAKTGRIRFLSHLDLMTLFHRAAVRAEIPLMFSQGFNPHPKIAFSPALSVGMESEAEYLDMEISHLTSLDHITQAFSNALPSGIQIRKSRIIPLKAPSLSGSISRYVYTVRVPAPYSDIVDHRLTAFSAQPTALVEKEGKKKDIKPLIESITHEPSSGTIIATLQDSAESKIRIQDVLKILFDASPEDIPFFEIVRTALYAKKQNQWIDPLENI